MEYKIALSEVQAMKGRALGEYTLAVMTPSTDANVILSEGGLPEGLDKSHALIEAQRAVLSERRIASSKLIVKGAVDSDGARIGALIRSHKITPAVGKQLITLCEKKRAKQLVKLAEGDPSSHADAADQDSDVNDFLGSLNDLPSQAAVTSDPAKDAAAVEGAGAAPDPTGAAGGGDDALMAAAEKIMAEKQIPFDQAVVEAEKMLKGVGGGGGTGPVTGGMQQ